MPKKAGIIFVTLGVVLILSALLLFLYNEFEDRCAGQQAESLMDEIQSVITEETDPTTKPTEIEIDVTESQETLPALMVMSTSAIFPSPIWNWSYPLWLSGITAD